MNNQEFYVALNAIKNQNAVIVDARTYDEYCQGHLQESVFIPTRLPPLSPREKENLKEQMKYTLRGIPKNVPIVTYCKKGIRARIATNMLKELGWNSYVLGGVTVGKLGEVFSGKMPVLEICRACH